MANSLTYELHTIGWRDFQQLSLTIATEVLGQTVQSFLDSRDGGRDGAFAGTWDPTGGESLGGQFVIQCKHTSRNGYALRQRDIADELRKAKVLVRRGLCDSYILITNAALSGAVESKIKASLTSAGVKHVLILGSTWISQRIRESKRLRMLVPRLYGLGDLSQILDERAYEQAKAILESMREDLSKVVVTDAYRRAAGALDKHGFVLLIGEPAAGKTTIASLLAMAAVDQWHASMLKLDEPGKLIERWNPHEPSQFFWLDDAFGVQQYEDFLVHRWNHVLPSIRTVLAKGAKIVMTSRDYIYNSARRDLKENAFPLLNESKVVIDVHELSIDEKRQILYNHLKLGGQRRSFRKEIKPHLERVAAHRRFIPETARRLSDPLFTKELFIDAYYLDKFVEKREQLLREVIQGLDRHSRAALGLIYMRAGRLVSPVTLERAELDAVERLGSHLGSCLAALDALKGSLVVLSNVDGEAAWSFKHPTIADAYAAILVESPEHLGIYIKGTTASRIVQQVTCGDVGIEKAVVIPRSLFPQVLTKLNELQTSPAYKSVLLSQFDARRDLLGFLARRCSKEFLTLYTNEHPEVLNQVSQPGLFLDTVPEVRLAARLHEFGMLPEDKRITFVETVSRYAINGEDTYALKDSVIQSVFNDSEFEQLVARVRETLLPRLRDVRLGWQGNYTGSDRAEEHMYQLVASFQVLEEAFADDEAVLEIVQRETQRAQQWAAEHTPAEREREPRVLEVAEKTIRPESLRSVFDDIDEGDI